MGHRIIFMIVVARSAGRRCCTNHAAALQYLLLCIHPHTLGRDVARASGAHARMGFSSPRALSRFSVLICVALAALLCDAHQTIAALQEQMAATRPLQQHSVGDDFQFENKKAATGLHSFNAWPRAAVSAKDSASPTQPSRTSQQEPSPPREDVAPSPAISIPGDHERNARATNLAKDNPNDCNQLTACMRGEASAPARCSLSCLQVPIPAWRVSYCKAHECLGACLAEHVPKDRYDFWKEKLMSTWIGWHHGVESRDALILGHNFDMMLADQAKMYRALHATAMVADNASSWRPGCSRRRIISLQGVKRFAQQYVSLPGSLSLDNSTRPETGQAVVVFNTDRPLGLSDLMLLQSASYIYFVNNPATRHPLLRPYPRGVQQTQKWHELFAGSQSNASLCAQQLRRDRPHLLMCRCLNEDRPGRRSKLDALHANGFQCATPVSCNDYHTSLFEHKFVFSPWGAGHNNHRDFEALYAGAVPIVDHDANLAPIFEGLPVLSVSNYSTITPAYLEALWRTMAAQNYDWAKLYTPYWTSSLLNAAAVSATSVSGVKESCARRRAR